MPDPNCCAAWLAVEPPPTEKRVDPYWLEAVGEALCEVGLWEASTEEQRKALAEEMKFAAQMEGEATGRDCIPNPMNAEIERLKKAHAEEVARLERIAEIWKLEGCRIARIEPHRAYINHGEVYVSRS